MNNIGKNMLLWLMIVVLLVSVLNLFQSPSQRPASTAQQITFSEFLDNVQADKVQEVVIQGETIRGSYRGEGASQFVTQMPDNTNVVDTLRANKVNISALPPSQDRASLVEIFLSWLPMLLFIGVWVYVMRQMQSSNGKAMGFGKSKAKLLTEKTGRVTFDDVAGID